MSISDIVISFIISLVTGILSGVLLTSKGNPDRPTIIQIQQNIIKKEYRTKIIAQQEPKSSYNSSDNNIGILIIVSIVIFIATVTFFAKHRDIIIIWGWRTIAFGSSVVVTSMIVSFIRERRLEFAGVWTLISWIAIIYIYWIFCNPNLDGYILYLEEVSKGKSVDFNDYSLFAFNLC